MEQTFFYLFFLLSTTKNFGHYIENKHKKTLKDREKKADGRTLEPREQYGGEFPGFFFRFVYLRLRTEETGNAERPMDTDRRNAPQSLFLQSEDQEVGSLIRQKTFRQRPLYSSQTAQPRCGPTRTHSSKGNLRSLDLHLYQAVLRPPAPPQRRCQRRPRREPGPSFSSKGGNEALPAFTVSVETVWTAATKDFNPFKPGRCFWRPPKQGSRNSHPCPAIREPSPLGPPQRPSLQLVRLSPITQ